MGLRASTLEAPQPLLRTLDGHQDKVLSVAFSPDGQTLASASADNTIKLWNPAAGTLLRSLVGHQGSVNSVAFSPDGQTLASASADNTIKLWNPATGSLLRTLVGHEDSIRSVAFSPDGKTLASASDDGSFRQWRVPDGDPEFVSMVFPANEWITYVPHNLYYTSSEHASDYLAIRFDAKRPRALYPLSRPEYVKLRVPDVSGHSDDPPPELKPDLLYDARITIASHYRVLSAVVLIYLVGVTLTLFLSSLL